MRKYEKEKDWAFRQFLEKIIILIIVVGSLMLLGYNIVHVVGAPFKQLSELLP